MANAWGELSWNTGNFGAQNDSDTLVNGIPIFVIKVGN